MAQDKARHERSRSRERAPRDRNRDRSSERRSERDDRSTRRHRSSSESRSPRARARSRSRSPERRRHRRRERHSDSGSGGRRRSHHRRHRKRGRSSSRSRSRSRSPSRREHRHSSGGGRHAAADELPIAAALAADVLGDDGSGPPAPLAHSIAGYTNDDNPFGDARLTERFRWAKKEAADVRAGRKQPSAAELSTAERERLAMAEIEQAKQRRAERDNERAMWEEVKLTSMRERESANFAEWSAKEEAFHQRNARSRAAIRLRERRPRAIDFLVLAMPLDESAAATSKGADHRQDDTAGVWLEFDIHDPVLVMSLLDPTALGVLERELAGFLALDPDARFWDLCLRFARGLLAEHAQNAATDASRDGSAGTAAGRTDGFGVRAASVPAPTSTSTPTPTPTPTPVPSNRARGGRAAGLHAHVRGDVAALLHSKTYAELLPLEAEISATIARGGAIDTEYWDALLERVHQAKLMAEIRDYWALALQAQLDAMRAAVADEEAQELADAAAEAAMDLEPDAHVAGDAGLGSGVAASGDALARARAIVRRARESGRVRVTSRALSPELFTDETFGEGPIVDERDDLAQRAAARRPGAPRAAPSATPGGDGDDEDEECEDELAAEATLDAQAYWWADKYRPRKPRFIAKTIASYEWTAYNRTHYSRDEGVTPPKIVRGYMFTLFAPDLVDRTRTPTFALVKNPDGETATLRFTLGPPYEDVAFRVLDREWEKSPRYGYRCTFDRGVLTLKFRFKRWRYRR